MKYFIRISMQKYCIEMRIKLMRFAQNERRKKNGKRGLIGEEYKEILLWRAGRWKQQVEKKNIMNRKFIFLHVKEMKFLFYNMRKSERRVQKKKKDSEMNIQNWVYIF